MTKKEPKLYKNSIKENPAPIKPLIVGADPSTWAPVAQSKQSKSTSNTPKQNLYKDSPNQASENIPEMIVGKDKSSWSPSAQSEEIVEERPIGDDRRSWSPISPNESQDQTANNNRELYQSHEDWRRAAEEKEGPKLDADIQAFTNKEAEVWEAGMVNSEDQSEVIDPSLKKKKKKNDRKNAA